MTKRERAERDEALAKLREWIKPGDTVYTILRHVSRSGMQREIGVVLMRENGDLHPNYLVAQAIGAKLGKRDGIIVGGCGMDMGYHIVYSLSSALFRDNFECIGKGDDRGAFSRCPSNDHTNGDRDYSPHKHSDGGYALRHRWL